MEITIQDIAQHANIMVRSTKAAEVRQKYGVNTIVLYRVGNTYECYNASAEMVHKECKFAIIYHGDIPFLDFKKDCVDWVLPKLVRAGYKICILDDYNY